MTRILRLATPSPLISATVFEALFDRHQAAWFDCSRRSHVDWFREVLGPATAPLAHPEVPAAFAGATRGFDFICPGFQATHLIPLLLAWRNRSRSSVRLLFINHSPGVFAYVFGLLPALLRPGDVIVAPSRSAARVVTALVPTLAPYVHVIHHPMEALAGGGPAPKTRPVRLVTLGRLVPDKLIHRQIEALHRLVHVYGHDAEMVVAGETLNHDTQAPSAYFRSLTARTRRLGLEDRVQFPGVIRDPAAKGRLLASADAMLYLSCTLEEAFPKGAVEALAAGIPVVAANWNGFPEIVGPCGALVNLHETPTRSLDIAPDEVARAVERCLGARPAAALCRARGASFGAASAEAAYTSVVRAAMRHDPASHPPETTNPSRRLRDLLGEGLLARIPFLADLGVTAAMEEYRAYAGHLRGLWEQGTPLPEDDPGYNTDLLVGMSLKKRLEHLYAGIPYPLAAPAAGGTPRGLEALPIPARVAAGIAGGADEDAVAAGLHRLAAAGERQALAAALEATRARGIRNRAVTYAETRLLCRQQEYRRALACFQAAYDGHAYQEHEWPLVRLLNRIYTALGENARGRALLRGWLGRYPDALGAGLVWLDAAQTLGATGAWDAPEVRESLARAEALLGSTPRLTDLQARAWGACLAADHPASGAEERP